MMMIFCEGPRRLDLWWEEGGTDVGRRTIRMVDSAIEDCPQASSRMTFRGVMVPFVLSWTNGGRRRSPYSAA